MEGKICGMKNPRRLKVIYRGGRGRRGGKREAKKRERDFRQDGQD
jgi:hypothetical protein